jgi:iron complex outermembrane receptor protein
MQRNSILSRACALALAGVMAWGGDAFAQQERGIVETVIVTAERRSQDLQTSAISATVLNAVELENKSVYGLTALQFAAPGLYIADYSSANTFNIRGIGQSTVNFEYPNGVQIYRDGVPTLTGYFQNSPYFDLAGVEVLRGPQGVSAGKSAAAGAVFIRTRDPELDDFGGDLMLGAGDYDRFEGTGVLNVPLTDTMAMRFAYHGERFDSYFDSVDAGPSLGTGFAGGPPFGSDDKELDTFRIGFLWQPGDAFRAVFKIDFDNLYLGNHAVTSVDPVTADLEDVWDVRANGSNTYEDEGSRSSLRLGYTFDNGVQLNSLTGYSTVTSTANWHWNGDNPTVEGWRSHGDFTNWSQEVNIVSQDDQRFRWLAGFFWQKYQSDFPDNEGAGLGYDYDDDGFQDLGVPYDRDEYNVAFFGQVAFDLTDALELQLGARLSNYRSEQETGVGWSYNLYELFFGPVPPDRPPPNAKGHGVVITDFNRDTYDEDETDWKVNLNYTINDTQFVYGLVSRGHTTGGLNVLNNDFSADGSRDPFDPMVVINYEAGWKGAFFDGQLLTQTSLYYQTYDDYQAGFASTAPNATPLSQISQAQNADTESEIYGVEVGAQAIIDNWAIDLGFAYSKSELGSFGQIDNILFPLHGPQNIDLDGVSTPFAPEVTANVGIARTFQLGGFAAGWIMTPRVDVAYRDDTYSSLFQGPSSYMDDVTLTNVQLRFENGPWWINFWCSNCTDEEYAAAKQDATVFAEIPGVYEPNPGADAYWYAAVYGAPPRTLGVRMGRSF